MTCAFYMMVSELCIHVSFDIQHILVSQIRILTLLNGDKCKQLYYA